jgi:hypothetical protein
MVGDVGSGALTSVSSRSQLPCLGYKHGDESYVVGK